MIDRAKPLPGAGLSSPSVQDPIYVSDKFRVRHAPVARMLLTLAVVAISIAVAMLVG
jgi:hypothetical protein